MKRAWAGIALLSTSWLAGLGYYHAPNRAAWVALVAAGTALLTSVIPQMPGRGAGVAALVLALPAILIAPWPYVAAPALLAAGLLLRITPIPRRWPTHVGSAAIVAGAILIAQALTMLVYESLTARSHDLPMPPVRVLGAVAAWLGIDSAVAGPYVAMFSMRQTHMLAATWELLLDPPTLCFLVGGVVAVLLGTGGCERAFGARLRAIVALTACVAAWVPVRAGLLMALYLHRVLRTDYDASLDVMNQFWSTPLHLLLLAGPVLLAYRFVRIRADRREAAPVPCDFRRPALPMALACAGVACLTTAILWHPVGERKVGRVVVDEHRSQWERTDRPFDTEWYGHSSGYNYACLYDYCSRFYAMSRLTTKLGDDALRDVDVLIVKVPTTRYAADEIEAIRRFVERGGGLLLIGEHTDVFGTGTYLNDIARLFGFRFRYDCLFGVDSVFEQAYRPAIVPHPIVQHLRSFDFAVSCSIAPGVSAGRAVIRSVGLKNLPADYHASNFYPQAEDRPDMRYGAFVQLWATRHGNGRVAAFTDSTVFSNFSMFEPGKPELLLGMIEWLNHGGRPRYSAWWPLAAGVALLGVAILMAGGWSGGWLPLLASGLLGWAVAVAGIRAIHLRAMPLPRAVRPMVNVIIDRTVCDTPLSRGGFIAGAENGFGIFERWILRLGYFTRRADGGDAFAGDLLVFCYPNKPVPDAFRDRLARYVEGGGRVLVIDSPENKGSTANSLLYPFKLALRRPADLKGPLAVPPGWPSVAVAAACEIEGGRAFARIGDKPVAASARHGKGEVAVIGFGSRFADLNMGVTGDIVPGDDLRKVFDLQFAILRAIVEGSPASRPTTVPAPP